MNNVSFLVRLKNIFSSNSFNSFINCNNNIIEKKSNNIKPIKLENNDNNNIAFNPKRMIKVKKKDYLDNQSKNNDIMDKFNF